MMKRPNPALLELIKKRGQGAGTPLFDSQINSQKLPNYISSGLINSAESLASSQRLRKTQTQQVYEALKKLGTANDRMLSEATGIVLSRIPDRRARLEMLGMIEFNRRDIDPVTKKMVNYYIVRVK